jgi:GTPase SAR1 family protein
MASSSSSGANAVGTHNKAGKPDASQHQTAVSEQPSSAGAAEPPEVLFLGAEGCGKSLLIRRLCEICKFSRQYTSAEPISKDTIDLSAENTIPTIGVDLNFLALSDSVNLNIREVGATMASRWDSYYDGCSTIIFIIDSSDLGSVAAAVTLLHEVLSNCKRLTSKYFAVAFTKTDLSDPITVTYMDNILRIQEICLRYPNLCIFRGSSLDGSLALLLMEWFHALF